MSFGILKHIANSNLKDDDIKVKFNSRRNKTIIIIIIIILCIATFFTVFLEYTHSQNRIILATTTSTYDSGLLDEIIPEFEKESGITVEILSVGTGQAIETGERGDADVLLVHSRSKEDDFVEDGYGVHRVCVMYNDFIIIGPEVDPAGIRGETVEDAMKKLKDAGENGQIEFYSRGDDSGTHNKELKLWDLIDFEPDTKKNDWYKETGSGMADTLKASNEERGYTLVDRGTWLSQKDDLDLELLVEGEEILLNPYGAIAVNPEVNSNVNYYYAMEFIAFLVSKKGQKMIGNFEKAGETLFHPCFGECDETHSCDTTDEEVDYWKDRNGGYKGSSKASILISIMEYLPYKKLKIKVDKISKTKLI